MNAGNTSIRQAGLLAGAFGIVTLAVASGPILAQEGGEGDSPSANGQSSGGIEEITVTARRKEESLMEVPVTITAVTAEAIDMKGIEDRRDLNRFTPGFKAAPQNTSSASRLINTYGMRGLGTVNLFWNGVPLGGGDIPEMLDLQRVEVLRGPQNAYFGRSTFSGAVNFVPQMAGFDFEGYAGVDIGTYDMRNLKAGVQGTLVEDMLAGRIAADYRDFGGQYDNYGYGGEKLGQQETVGVSGSLLFTPIDDLQIRTYLAKWEVDDGPNAITYLQVDDYTCNAGGAPAGEMNFFCGEISRPRADRISQRTTFPPGVIEELAQVATHATVGPDFIEKPNGLNREGDVSQLFVDYTLPNDFTASIVLSTMQNKAGHIFDYGSRYYEDLGTYNPSITTYLFEDDYAEFRLESNQAARLRGLIGFSTVESSQVIQSVLNRSGELAVNFPPLTNFSDTEGVFGSLSYDFSDRITATIEGRYQEDTIGRVFEGGQVISGTTYSFVPRLTVDYKLSDEITTFASYSEGSRPGALNTGYIGLPPEGKAQIDAEFDVPRVVPEQKLENYEVGIKGDFFDNSLRVLGALYVAEWTGRPNGAALFYTNDQGVLTQANILVGSGAVDAMGMEWELVWTPTDRLTVDATLAVNDTEIVHTVCTACQQITGNLNPVGTKYPRFPSSTASLGVMYRHAAFNDWEAFYRIDTNYQGKEYADETNVVWLAPYMMSSARAGLRNDRYRLEFYGLNIFDNQVPQSIAQTTEQIAGRPTLTVTPPLKPTFGIRASVDF